MSRNICYSGNKYVYLFQGCMAIKKGVGISAPYNDFRIDPIQGPGPDDGQRS